MGALRRIEGAKSRRDRRALSRLSCNGFRATKRDDAASQSGGFVDYNLSFRLTREGQRMTRVASAIMCFFLGCAVLVFGQSGEWATFTAGLEGFSVKMPGPPQRVPPKRATASTFYRYAEGLKTPKSVAYIVGSHKYDDAEWDADIQVNWILQDLEDAFAHRVKVVSRKRRDYITQTPDLLNPKAKTQTYPGVEASVARMEAPGVVRGTLVAYVDKRRMREIFLLYLVGPEATYSEENARRFFDSLTFLY